MNGNGYDYYGDEYSGFVSEPMATPSPAPSSTSGGFLQTLTQTFEKFTSRPTTPADGVESAIYNAIYSFGAGKADVARSQLADAFLASRSGSAFATEVENKRMAQLAPMFIIGAVLLFGIAFALGRR